MSEFETSTLAHESLPPPSPFPSYVEHALQTYVPRYLDDLITQLHLPFALDSLMDTIRKMLPYFTPLNRKLRNYCRLVILYHMHQDTSFSLRDACQQMGVHFSSDFWIRFRQFINSISPPTPPSTCLRTYLVELYKTFPLTEIHLKRIRRLTNLSVARHYDLRARMGAALWYVVREYHLTSISITQILAWTRSSSSSLYGIWNCFRIYAPSLSNNDQSSSTNPNSRKDRNVRFTVHDHGYFYYAYRRYRVDSQLAGKEIVLHIHPDSRIFEAYYYDSLLGQYTQY